MKDLLFGLLQNKLSHLFSYMPKKLLRSVLVKVMLVVCLKKKGTTSIKKLLAYSKLFWVEAKCTVYWIQQA